MIDVLWKEVYQLWDQRNGHVHGVDASTRAQKQKTNVHRELVAVYAARPAMRHCDRDMFYASAEAHLEAQPTWAVKNWLRVYQPLVKHSIPEAVRQAVLHVRTITSYFRPTEPPD